MSETKSQKRDREENIEDLTERASAFGRSKKVLRSPEYRSRKTGNNLSTESEKKILKSPQPISEKEEKNQRTKNTNTYKKTTGDTEASENEMEELKDMMKEMMKDIKELKAEMQTKEKLWKEEKEQLINRIEILEKNAEREEKEKRKNNIIIKGVSTEHEAKQTVEKLFTETLGVQSKIIDAFKINKPDKKGILLVKMENWHMKQEVMKMKNKLKGSQIYIEHDLTNEERKIQWEIRNIAKEENAKGKQTRIGFKKLIINGEEFVWNNKENGLINRKDCEEYELGKKQ